MTKEKFVQKCRKTHEIEYIYDRVPEEFNTKEKPYIEIICPICKNVWKVRYDQFQNGSNCPHCTKSGRKVKEENFDKIKELHKELKFIKFEGTTGRCTFICPKHGEQTLSTASLLRESSGCPLCRQEEQTMIKEEFIELATEIYNDKYDYDLVDEYTPANSLLKIRCKKCNNIFVKERRIFLRGNTCCPYCDKKSSGNIKIKSFLIKNKILFEEEKRFDDCRYKSTLPYDFYLPERKILIEYQGIQHYSIQRFGGMELEKAKKNFEEQQIKDEIKEKYAKNNGYLFLKINYDENIEEKLSFLKKKCSICGGFLKNGECPNCKRTSKLRNSSSYMIQKINSSLKHSEFVSFEGGEYKNYSGFVICRCKICNSEFKKRAFAIINLKQDCPNCDSKHLTEQKVYDELKSNGIFCEREKTFEDLKYKKNLRFDLYLPEKNIAIEIQGPHHFKPFKYNKLETDEQAEIKYKEQQIKDEIKREWCKENNVVLIEKTIEELNTINKIEKFVKSALK
jgi:very-short-patch-repair endonuclease